MKKIYTLIFLLCICLVAKAQEATPKLEGIGKFKINVANLSLVEDISKELQCKVNMINSYSAYIDFSRGYSQIYQIAPFDHSYSSNPPESPSCEGVQVFYINKYKVADIPIDDIFLTFKDGLLVKFQCKPSTAFTEAVKLKYGSGELTSKTNIITCQFKMTGAKAEYEENTYTTTWTNGDIVGTSLLMAYYNDKCQKQYINQFYIEDKPSTKEIDACERETKRRASQTKNEEKKKKLADF